MLLLRPEASRVVCVVVVVVVGGTGFAAVEGVSIVGLNDVGAGVVRGTKGTERGRLVCGARYCCAVKPEP